MSFPLYTRKSVLKISSFPDGYERLLVDALNGDHSLFVRNDELVAAWAIFTPLLLQMYNAGSQAKAFSESALAVLPYPFGTFGPEAANEQLRNLGVRYSNL